MSISAASDVPLHPEVNQEDLEQVREMIFGLLEDSRKQERDKRIALAAATWISAFASFKRVRRNIGLPRSDNQWLVYGSIVASLKAAGKMLLAGVNHSACDLSQFGIDPLNFQACVEELRADDRAIELELHKADFTAIDAALA